MCREKGKEYCYFFNVTSGSVTVKDSIYLNMKVYVCCGNVVGLFSTVCSRLSLTSTDNRCTLEQGLIQN